MCALNSTVTSNRSGWTRLHHALRGADAGIQLALMTAALGLTALLEAIVGLLELSWTRLRVLPRGEDGYTTQTVIMTAILAALAIAAGAIIYTKVIDKANSIDLNGNTGTGS